MNRIELHVDDRQNKRSCRIKSHSLIHSFIHQPITVKPNLIIFLCNDNIESKYEIEYFFPVTLLSNLF